MNVTLIGMGCGPETLSGAAKDALDRAELVIGSARLLSAAPAGNGCEKKEAVRAGEIFSLLSASDAREACVLFSGDTGFFSGARSLLPLLEGFDVHVLPGISSMQLFAARLERPWEEWLFCSAHGRACDVVSMVCRGKPVFFLTGGGNSPASLCRELTEAGLGFLRVFAGEDLGTKAEQVREGTAAEFAQETFSPLSVLLVLPAPRTARRAPGLPDECFERLEGVPMTKQEVRAVISAKLGITPEDVCWDIGAGTGSVGIELALQAKSVWAVERNAQALALAEKNRAKLGAWNLHLMEGTAPEALSALPAPDAVFVGGSGGKLSEILHFVYEANPLARICVSAIAPESLATARETLTALGLKTEVTLLSAARSRDAGGLHLMMGLNPVWLITGENE